MSRFFSSFRNQLIVCSAAAVVTTSLVAVRVEKLEEAEKLAASIAQGSDITGNPAIVPKDSRSASSLHILAAAEGYRDSAAFLDSNRNTLWELQTSNMNASYLKKLTEPSKLPKSFGVEVLRGTTSYASTVTPMRVVGYFPNIAPKDLHAHITDQTLRLKWDKNYDMFSIMHSDDAVRLAVSVPDINQSSITHAVTSALPKESVGPLQQNWACHRVSSSLLQKFGVKAKLFQYERVSWSIFEEAAHVIAYRSIVDPKQSYPLGFAPPPKPVQKAIVKKKEKQSPVIDFTQDHASFTKILEMFFKRYEKPEDEKVIMHHQTIALLPIRGTSTANLEHALLDARSIGSVTDNSFLDFVSQNKKRIQESGGAAVSAQIQGTLMILTSLNETPIPKAIPQWAQKRAAHFFTSQAYEMLYHCALANTANHHTK
ncbi:Hypothetical protein, putative [Bodo saltans]|uniref:Uncharacterized protein n=1 Tax=Bodo saltans TaxID=75058 RepID=A0A0S4J6P5_BODSA|nr:Hypothetical protein, putative [Bodo saltans]|eukprot:CUG86870.1 Hypothetical protein, putative [Bodo saltans]